MKRLIFVFLLLPSLAFGAFSEFFVQTTGSNLNAGSTNTNAAAFTYASGTWVASTGVFTVASGNPTSDGVAVGDFASVYPDGSTVGVFVGRVTARSSTTITVSLTAKSGTAPTDGTSNRTLKVGGAWKGPNAAEAFPFGFAAGTMTDSTGNIARINFKNSATYSVTAAMTHSVAGPIQFQGYTSTPGDLGRATIDGGTTGTSYQLLVVSGGNFLMVDLIFQNNGATSGQTLVVFQSAGGNQIRRCVFANCRTSGLTLNVGSVASECEAYGTNQNGGVNQGAFNLGGNSATLIRCIAHDNTGSNGHGIRTTAVNSAIVDCILESNGGAGIELNLVTTGTLISGTDFYNNGGDGVRFTAGAGSLYAMIENCNFVKNGGYGINRTGAGLTFGTISNCAFGAGTQVNTSGQTNNLFSMETTGSVTYASNVTPWVDPANGDFRINLAAAKNAGRGAFTQTAASYAGTIGYPDIGAAQHLESAPTPAGTSHTFVQ